MKDGPPGIDSLLIKILNAWLFLRCSCLVCVIGFGFSNHRCHAQFIDSTSPAVLNIYIRYVMHDAAHYFQRERPQIKRDWHFWQHSEQARVNGIATAVDMNVFAGDSLDFYKLLVR